MIIGENELIFIDKGRKDGVAVGNTFFVVYQGDPLTGPDEDLPEERLAKLLIVDVKEHASTALVTYAIREIEVGNTVVMLPALKMTPEPTKDEPNAGENEEPKAEVESMPE